MEVAPQELAQLLKLAGVGAGPEPDIMSEPEVMSEPDMPGSEIEPEISVMAIPSDDGAPVGGGCGAPEPEHDHEHDPGGEMRGIIDMLQGGGEEPIEESPPKDDYENASNEFTGHPVDVVDSYDQYSYEPAKNSGMQRRTNSYGDNPLREEDLIKEYAEFKYLLERDPQDILKEKPRAFGVGDAPRTAGDLRDVRSRIQSDKDLDAEFDRLGLGKWYDVSSMWKSDDEERAEKLQAIQDYHQKASDTEYAGNRGEAGEDEAMASAAGISTDDSDWREQLAAQKAEKAQQIKMADAARAHKDAWGKGDEGDEYAKSQLAKTDSASSLTALATADTAMKDAENLHYQKAAAQYAKTGDASAFASNSNMSPELRARLDTTRKDPAALANLSGSKAPNPQEIALHNKNNKKANIAGTAGTGTTDAADLADPGPGIEPKPDAAQKAGFNLNPNVSPSSSQMTQPAVPKAPKVATNQVLPTRAVTSPVTKPLAKKSGQNSNLNMMYRTAAERAKAKKAKSAVQPQVSTGGRQGDPEVAKLYAGKYSDGLDRLKLLAGI